MWETLSSFLKPLRFIAIVVTGLLAGILCDFMFFITPALATLGASSFTETTKAIDKQFFDPIPWVYTVSNFAILFVLLLLIRQWRSAAFMLTLLALICALASTASSLLINVPINVDVINNWSVQNPPAYWSQSRDTWDQANVFRAILEVIGFAALVITVLLPTRETVAAVERAPVGAVQSTA
jgi:uncharacterized membrane protein